MNHKLQQIVRQFRIGTFMGAAVYSRPASQGISEHLMVGAYQQEAVITAPSDLLRELDPKELIELQLRQAGYAVGFLAGLASRVIAAGLSIIVVSTYAKDIVLVRRQDLAAVKNAFISLGLRSILTEQ